MSYRRMGGLGQVTETRLVIEEGGRVTATAQVGSGGLTQEQLDRMIGILREIGRGSRLIEVRSVTKTGATREARRVVLDGHLMVNATQAELRRELERLYAEASQRSGGSASWRIDIAHPGMVYRQHTPLTAGAKGEGVVTGQKPSGFPREEPVLPMEELYRPGRQYDREILGMPVWALGAGAAATVAVIVLLALMARKKKTMAPNRRRRRAR